MIPTERDYQELRKLPRERWFALGAIGHGFPSATARRLVRLGLLESRLAPSGMSRFRVTPPERWHRFRDYAMTERGREFLNANEWKPDYTKVQRRVVCSANRHKESGRIICGARHWDFAMRAQLSPRECKEGHGKWETGFIDQFCQYMDRREAWKVAEAAGQIYRRCGGDMSVEGVGCLYSENLY